MLFYSVVQSVYCTADVGVEAFAAGINTSSDHFGFAWFACICHRHSVCIACNVANGFVNGDERV